VQRVGHQPYFTGKKLQNTLTFECQILKELLLKPQTKKKINREASWKKGLTAIISKNKLNLEMSRDVRFTFTFKFHASERLARENMCFF